MKWITDEDWAKRKIIFNIEDSEYFLISLQSISMTSNQSISMCLHLTILNELSKLLCDGQQLRAREQDANTYPDSTSGREVAEF